MFGLRRSAQVYIGILATVALGSLIVALQSVASGLSASHVALATAFTGLMTLAYVFPLHFAFKTKLTLDTSVIFAAVLLFEPGVAMLIAGTGTLLGQGIRREPWIQALFNSSQATLQTGAAGILLALTGWSHQTLRFDQPGQIIMVATAAAMLLLVNTIAVSIIVGLQSGLSPWKVWRESIQFGSAEELALLALGLLGAVVVDVHAWTLLILLLPAVVVYRSLERYIQLRQQTLDAVEALADIVDLRDPYTANHSRRVALYARDLATALDLEPDEVDLIERVARVHDVGKVIVDLEVLSKEGRLDDTEWAQLKRHPVTGADILSQFPLFAMATSYVRHHHERMDGQGYPDGIAGEQIPLGARIIAVADSLDAMASARPYRKALPPDVVLAEFQRNRDIQWDANVVDALLELIAEGRIRLSASPEVPVGWDRHGERVPRSA